MLLPPNVDIVYNEWVDPGTLALTQRTVVAAPGVGFRLRIWGYGFSFQLPGGGAVPALWGARLRVGLAGNGVWKLSGANAAGDSILFPGGIRWSNDTAAVIEHQSSVALNVATMILITVEAV